MSRRDYEAGCRAGRAMEALETAAVALQTVLALDSLHQGLTPDLSKASDLVESLVERAWGIFEETKKGKK